MMDYKLFETPEAVVISLADTMLKMSLEGRPVHISLSGGSTPKLLFKTLAQTPYAESIQWHNLHFWWGDERCVEPTDPESNYGEANTLLFSHVELPEENIHRIRGEDSPEKEVIRFANEMDAVIPHKNTLPVFDWILLGMGGDGHTASLFPYKTDFKDENLTVIASHPESGQLRISKTARLLANAERITYLVLGESKAAVLKEIHDMPEEALPYPAAKVKSTRGKTEWYLDAAAAKLFARGE
ncbi:6-phosphogluconolactonase [Vibrio sp. HA2012]|uniref:6-phosphogluconolactonase n=1 Tax=Vibrio sp. HA2012 TaxID=1971595 RepID=UPI000C2C6730|nr:6-phosphogluconolactonase [Vibrio sp. HA2012]PJC87308.1 6-phosphogluconolactonase [Vibrio sp. HA2012]